MQNQSPNDESKTTGEYAAILSLVEVGLGSLLHGLKIPMAGHFLAINQNAIMSRIALKLNLKKSALEIALIASILKSLSPAGKKLTPMLAISTQGILFSFGLGLGGMNRLGLLIGHTLSCTWGFAQPLLILYFLFGNTSLSVAQYFIKEFSLKFGAVNDLILYIVLGIWGLKIILSLALASIVVRLSEDEFDSYQKKMLRHVRSVPKQATGNPYWLAFKDLLQPLFVISFVLTALFFYFSHSSYAQLIWALIRPLALGYLLFLAIRIFPVEKLIPMLTQKGHTRLAHSLELAIRKIKNFEQKKVP